MLTFLMVGLVACKKDERPIVVSDGYIESPSKEYEKLSQSSQEKFSDKDLIVDDVKAGISKEDLITLKGQPSDEKNKLAEANPEQVLIYKNDKYTTAYIFWPVDGKMSLCAVESDDVNCTFARDTKVGMKMQDVRDAYFRDENCLNTNMMSDDNATILGKFLYGDATLDKLEEKNFTSDLEYGVINYNGNDSFENSAVILEYLSLKKPFKSEYAGYDDDYSQILYYTDESGNISRICWYYYPEVK